MMHEEDRDAGADEPDLPLCPGCLAENQPAADFCAKCGQPLSAISTVDPFRRTLAQGHWLRSAASGRIPPIVFWGTWLLFLPSTIVLGVALAEVVGLPWQDTNDTAMRVVLICCGGGILMAMAVLLWRMTRNYCAARHTESDSDE